MDHETTREQLELAAAEPGGLERLMAGDTAAAQAVAAHLAGCPECTDELARLERTARLVRAVVREQAPADLRERTLAAVRASGVQRGGGPAQAGPAVEPDAAPTLELVHGEARRASSTPGRGRMVTGWVAAIAAAAVISVVATSFIVGAQVDQRLAERSKEIEALEDVTTATLEVTAEPDVR